MDRLTTSEMTVLYEVIAFSYGVVRVKRRKDGVEGLMCFEHMPRVYFNFVPDDK